MKKINNLNIKIYAIENVEAYNIIVKSKKNVTSKQGGPVVTAHETCQHFNFSPKSTPESLAFIRTCHFGFAASEDSFFVVNWAIP